MKMAQNIRHATGGKGIFFSTIFMYNNSFFFYNKYIVVIIDDCFTINVLKKKNI